MQTNRTAIENKTTAAACLFRRRTGSEAGADRFVLPLEAGFLLLGAEDLLVPEVADLFVVFF